MTFFLSLRRHYPDQVQRVLLRLSPPLRMLLFNAFIIPAVAMNSSVYVIFMYEPLVILLLRLKDNARREAAIVDPFLLDVVASVSRYIVNSIVSLVE